MCLPHPSVPSLLRLLSSPAVWAGTGNRCWRLPGTAQTSWRAGRWRCCTWMSWCSYSGWGGGKKKKKHMKTFTIFPLVGLKIEHPLTFNDSECDFGTGREGNCLTAYWNFSLYSLSLALTLLSSSADTKWVINGWYHNKDKQKALQHLHLCSSKSDF